MHPAPDEAFSRALAAETLESERLRARVLALMLAGLIISQMVAILLLQDHIRRFLHRELPIWEPLLVFGPFLAYECVLILVLSRFLARGIRPPAAGRYINVAIETSLPTVLIVMVANAATPEIAFATWPSLLYFVFIVASTLRLNFALPMFTGAVAAAEYWAVASYFLPLSLGASEPVHTPMYHGPRAVLLLLAGAIAGGIAVRLRRKFEHAMTEATARERVTSLFGQHVSPAVVERLLDRSHAEAGDRREVCVMFLDIRDFTSAARQRAPEEVVGYLNGVFAFMIEAVDRHHGFINKFLGDGFMAVFGAPLEDPKAVTNAVAAAREILAEIDRRGLGQGGWPLRIGIGLHAGPAITGNVGSPRRKEFTVIGDTVNFAARLEQLTKEHGARLLVSDAVAKALDGENGGATLIGAVPVKGYAEPQQVWRLA